MKQLPSVLTPQQYGDELASFITSEMQYLPEGKKTLAFWTDFNRSKKIEFDAFLEGAGIVVEETK